MNSPLPEDAKGSIARLVLEHLCTNQKIRDLEKKYPLELIIREVTSRISQEYREHSLKEAIVKTCKSFYHMGFLAGTSGNVSILLNEQEILITASGINKGSLSTENIVKVNFEGTVLAGQGKASSEVKMHLFCYRQRKDINAIVHAHPPFATGFATARIPLDKPVLPEAILVLGPIPLVDYGTPSTWEVPQALSPFIDHHNTFLLANHGTLTLGTDIEQAAHMTETLELFAKVILIARMLGGEKLLTAENLEKLARSH